MIRTIEQLSDHMSRQIVWRRKELSDLKYLIEAGRTTERRRKALTRAGIAILYAHWEGFVKIGGTCYLEFIAMQRLRNAELNYNLLTLVLRSKLDAATQSKRLSALGTVTEFFCTKMEARAAVPYKKVIATEANLSYRVFTDILWLLGLETTSYETKKNIIDFKLLGRRNHIAHGQAMDIDVGDYLDLHEEVDSLMNTFRNQIENAAVDKQYMR